MYNIKTIIETKNPGEAEIKIKNQILLNHQESDLHILYTNDADVILILSATPFYQNLFVYSYESNKKFQHP